MKEENIFPRYDTPTQRPEQFQYVSLKKIFLITYRDVKFDEKNEKKRSELGAFYRDIKELIKRFCRVQGSTNTILL